MSLKILASVFAGTILGYLFLPASIQSSLGIAIDLGLMLLLFFVGIDIGKQKGIYEKIKKIGFKVLLVPVAIIIGSLGGAMLSGVLFLKMPINEAGAVGAGLGWYSLSSTMLLADGYLELSALAFLSNVIREIIALVSIPLVAKYIGNIEAIAPAAAMGMDTCLPVISKATDPQTTIVSFITGVICTSSVPILLPIILNFKF